MHSIVIVDDCPNTINRIKNIIENNFTDLLIHSADSIPLLDKLRNDREYDIYILDVEIGKDNGVEYGIRIRETNRISDIIFVTSYDQYAVEGYKAGACGYLLKPVNTQALISIIENSLTKLRNKKFIHVKENRKTISLELNNILLIERSFRKSRISTQYGDIIETNEPLIQLIKRSEYNLIQINRSIVINPLYIDSIYHKDKCITLINGNMYKISRHFYRSFLETLCKGIL